MAANSGRNWILSVSDMAGTPVFTQTALFKTVGIDLSNSAADITNQQSAGNKELLAGTGILNIAISGDAVYDNADTTGIIAMRDSLIAKTGRDVRLTDGTETYEFLAFVETWAISADQTGTDAGQVSVALVGSGTLTIT